MRCKYSEQLEELLWRGQITFRVLGGFSDGIFFASLYQAVVLMANACIGKEA
jgi:hypothetical protein